MGDGEGDGFGYDVFPFEGEEFSYALGAQVRHAALYTYTPPINPLYNPYTTPIHPVYTPYTPPIQPPTHPL